MVAPDNRSLQDAPSGPAFWLMFAVGWAIMAFGIKGLIQQPGSVGPDTVAPWLIGSAVVHDFLVAPAVIALGVVIVRLVPGEIRRFVQTGMVLSGAVIAVAAPLLIGLGGQAGNSSALPHNYRVNVLIVLAVVWLGIVVAALVGRRGS